MTFERLVHPNHKYRDYRSMLLKAKGYNGYLLTRLSRQKLLDRIAPVHHDVIAHHITHKFNVYDELPPFATYATVIAVASNDKVQAAVVKIDGKQLIRPDGKFYHVTVSVNRLAGGKPVDSNKLIEDKKNWTHIDPFNITIVPTFFPFKKKG